MAYVAGFLDGEGCIYISKRRTKQYVLCVSATQKIVDPLLLLRDLFGGSIQEKDKGDCFAWKVSARKALTVLETVRPYLFVKAAQADVGIAFQQRRGQSSPALDEISWSVLKELKLRA